MAEGVLFYESAPRCGHIATAIEGKLHVWGGTRRNSPEVHDSPNKTATISEVDVLDSQVKQFLVEFKEHINLYAVCTVHKVN